MQRKPTITLILAVVAAGIIAGGGCDKLRARDQLNKGVEAFGSGQYDQAIEHFKSAQQFDPSLTNAQLYLAAASPDNLRNAQEAVKINQDILAADPNNLSAIDNLGSLTYNMSTRPFDQQGMLNAKAFHEKHIQISPNDPQPYYWIGVIDWQLAYNQNEDLRDEYNHSGKKPLKDTDPLPKELVAGFTQKEGQTVDEGITNLNKAIQLKPDYDDAMGYLSLLYRQKGDMETTPDARDADNKNADSLMEKVKAIKQQRELNSSSNPSSSS
jgi:tetratricopeptide (TPR) repeat protein